MSRLAGPLLLLVASLAAISTFSRGLGLADTVGMLVCGTLAGGALATLAGRRRTR
jgi:hypothetical protein